MLAFSTMRRVGISLLVLFALLIAILLGIFFTPQGPGKATNVRVARGEAFRTVATRLEFQGAIHNKRAFRALARLRGLDRELRPGRRVLPARASIWDVVQALYRKPVPFKISVPEGRTCWDVAGILERAQLSDSLPFAKLCEDSATAKRLGLPAKRLEGYLFPDTYLFDGSESNEEIARAMVRHFHSVWAGLDTTHSASFRELGAKGVLTLASIVEREAADRSECPRIAGVFYKRLHVNMTLGADPTVRYALRKFTGSLTVSELASNSPYNTRKFEGLPPGPISNPGRQALEAALHPDTTQGLLYFVARDDGSRRHDFSSDYNVFLRDKRAAASKRAETGRPAL